MFIAFDCHHALHRRYFVIRWLYSTETIANAFNQSTHCSFNNFTDTLPHFNWPFIHVRPLNALIRMNVYTIFGFDKITKQMGLVTTLANKSCNLIASIILVFFLCFGNCKYLHKISVSGTIRLTWAKTWETFSTLGFRDKISSKSLKIKSYNKIRVFYFMCLFDEHLREIPFLTFYDYLHARKWVFVFVISSSTLLPIFKYFRNVMCLLLRHSPVTNNKVRKT